MKVTRITCSIRQDQIWRSKNFTSESLNKCIGKHKDWRYRTHSTDLLNRREQVRLQEELSRKEKGLRNIQIRNMHEMGEIKRALEQRIDEVSVQKFREKLRDDSNSSLSQLQQMQEQMNYMSDSVDFQDVESNCSRRLSHSSS